ncbi:hypothetical protein OG500_23280 [Kitasatospora sp. NBC_01250]|uniref:hypothetical protein n=1 Tax=Kitasatospora sp. NBC_01250 TaxID=2903571 RepID=UPI002E37FAA7|nr:hypothetical protein [Kitasatospora sp. NBC_01250]
MLLRSPARPRRRLMTAAAVVTLGLAPLTAAAVAGAATPSDSRLEVVRMNPDPVPAGGQTVVHGFVANNGPDTTASPITMTILFPVGSYAAEPFFPTDCQPGMGGHSVTCVFPAGLLPGRSATALIPADVYAGTPAGTVLTGGRVTVTSPDDPNPTGHSQPFEILVR